MILDSVYIRFYKSFNYDSHRKLTASNRRHWEFLDGRFYPFVEVPIDSSITAVVGANESGKSHLLSAITKGLHLSQDDTDDVETDPSLTIERQDFCRYSDFFVSTKESQTYPDFGFKWSRLKSADMKRLTDILPDAKVTGDTPVYYFRFDRERHVLYIGADDKPQDITAEQMHLLRLFLPHVIRIESAVALPDSVSITRLLQGPFEPKESWTDTGRRQAMQLMKHRDELDAILASLSTLPVVAGGTHVALDIPLQKTVGILRENLKAPRDVYREQERQQKTAEFNLAYDLLFNIAEIKREDVQLLHTSLQKGQTSVVRSVVDKINQGIGRKLDFARVWAQDRDFILEVESSDHELNFLISDRTGCHYSFDERSSGLKHFLSYYIQYLRYLPQSDNEILLMDEPDAFLSGEAQGDLLRVFGMFADANNPKRKGREPLQVIYVTHSPFLIDKNHSERVQALQKGEGDRGTRVLKSAGQNHYEPLRSAFGPFVGETTFMSGCNLITEGQGDQILLAGVSSHLRRRSDVPENETLDLNRLTIVPAGGAATLPYFVYLARGKGGDKPAVIVLLDSDKAGEDARKLIVTKKGEHLQKQALLRVDFVVQIGDVERSDTQVDPTFLELEDLVPTSIAIRATVRFLQAVFAWSVEQLECVTQQKVEAEMVTGNDCAFFAINRLLLPYLNPQADQDKKQELAFSKVAFARTVVDLLPELEEERKAYERLNSQGSCPNDLESLEKRLRSLFTLLRQSQIKAEQDRGAKAMRDRIKQRVSTFLADYQDRDRIDRYVGQDLTEAVEAELTGGDEQEISFVRHVIVLLRDRFKLRQSPTEAIADLSVFLLGVQSLQQAKESVEANTTTDEFLKAVDIERLEDGSGPVANAAPNLRRRGNSQAEVSDPTRERAEATNQSAQAEK